ncbi:MAG: NAD(P)H-quinone oxidoreductase [Bacteroidota bacterium]
MKAILTHASGGSEQLYLGECPSPLMFKHGLRIKVQAAGVNRADILQRAGKYPPPQDASPITGLEVSGVVDAADKNCTRFKKGDRVMALLSGGGYSQYVVVNENLVMPVPENIDLIDAAGIPEVFITAYQVLFEIAQLKPYEWVLIHAGASGVGTAAIQLCHATGARCIASVRSDQKAEICKALGANVVINTRTSQFEEVIKEVTNNHGADVIVDPVGAAYFEKNLAAAAMDCRWVLIAGMGGVKVPELNLAKILTKRISLFGSTLRSRSLEYKSELVRSFIPKFLPKFNSGQIKPVIDKVFNIEHVAEAHDFMENNRNKGKILLTGF